MMTLDNINQQEIQNSFDETTQETRESLDSLKNDIIEENEKGSGTDKEENGDEKFKTGERIEINPEILKEEMRKDLKDISMMNSEEIKAELVSYGVEISEENKNNKIKLKNLLINARNIIANEDKNSDIIDFHIGTYTQGKSKYCTVLAQLDTMTDDEIKDMIQIKKDSDNKLSYYVTFPQDKGNDNATVKITEEELNSGILTIKENGQDRILDNLPKGDKDVTLITMAFIKRYGNIIIDNGARAYDTQNRFRETAEPKLKDNQYFEDIKDYSNLSKHTTIGLLNPDEIRRKGFDFKIRSEEEVSWIKDKITKMEATLLGGAAIMTLSNGKKACITGTYMYISDGTLITNGHAMSLRGYDEKTEELIVSGSEFNNISEVRIPKELFIFLETASLEGTPGVDRTPEPPTDELLEPPTE